MVGKFCSPGLLNSKIQGFIHYISCDKLVVYLLILFLYHCKQTDFLPKAWIWPLNPFEHMAPESFPEPTSLYPAVHQATYPTGRRDDIVEKLCWQDHYHLIAMGIDSKAKKGCTSGMTKVLNLVTKGTMALLQEVTELVSVTSHVILDVSNPE